MEYLCGAGGVGGILNDSPGRIHLGANNEVYVCGFYGPECDFDSIALPYTGGIEGYIIRYNTSGDIQWAKTLTGPGDEYLWDVEYVDEQHIFFTGSLSDSASWDTILWEGIEGADLIIGQINSEGEALWNKVSGAGDVDYGYNVEWVDNYLYGMGVFRDTIALDSISIPGAGGYDFFMGRIPFEIASTAIGTPETEAGFVLYPNPSTGEFVVKLDRKIHSGKLEVLDLAGRILHQTGFSSSEVFVRTNGPLPVGTYLVRIIPKGESPLTRRMIITR